MPFLCTDPSVWDPEWGLDTSAQLPINELSHKVKTRNIHRTCMLVTCVKIHSDHMLISPLLCGARCRSVVRVSLDRSFVGWTHWAISCSSQCSTTGCGMWYPVCGMVHIKEPLMLIGKSSLCGGSRFPFSLSEWSLTICLMPYNHK